MLKVTILFKNKQGIKNLALNDQSTIGSFHLKPHNFWPKNTWSQIFFSIKYTSIGSIRVHNPEYQPPVTSGSRITGCTNFVN